MTEPGSDDQLRVAGATAIDAGPHAEQARQAAEEARVTAVTPATDEPGEAYPDPDTTPVGLPPEYDPLPATD